MYVYILTCISPFGRTSDKAKHARDGGGAEEPADCLHIYIYIYICMYVCVYIHMYICVCVCVCLYYKS